MGWIARGPRIRQMPHTTVTAYAADTVSARPAAGAPARSERFYNTASIVLFGAFAAIVLCTFRDYGITWDEPVHRYYGLLIDRFYYYLLHGRYDTTAMVSFRNLYLYGGAFDGLVFAMTKLSPVGVYETRHLLNAFVGLLGAAGAWRLGRLLGGAKTGFWTALLLLVTPRYFGHMFNNPKDIPFAAAYVWSLYFLARAVPLVPRIPWKLAAGLIGSIGLALGLRIGGVLLLGYFA